MYFLMKLILILCKAFNFRDDSPELCLSLYLLYPYALLGENKVLIKSNKINLCHNLEISIRLIVFSEYLLNSKKTGNFLSQ